jgi:hypothetical protein
MLEGLHPNRPPHVMRLVTDERAARATTDILGEVFDPAETAVAAFEAEDGRTWLLEAYFASPPTRTRSATSCAPWWARPRTGRCSRRSSSGTG